MGEGVIMNCIGIDPGLSGGIAVIYESWKIGVFKMHDNLKDLSDFLGTFSRSNYFIVVEDQGPRPSYRKETIQQGQESIEINMPTRSAKATWTFAQHFGELRGILATLEIPCEYVKPKVWMKALGIPQRGKGVSQTEWKNVLKDRAQAQFPGVRVTLATCDALLIAEYCRRVHGGKLPMNPHAFDDI
jgi:hypothetical protein